MPAISLHGGPRGRWDLSESAKAFHRARTDLGTAGFNPALAYTNDAALAAATSPQEPQTHPCTLTEVSAMRNDDVYASSDKALRWNASLIATVALWLAAVTALNELLDSSLVSPLLLRPSGPLLITTFYVALLIGGGSWARAWFLVLAERLPRSSFHPIQTTARTEIGRIVGTAGIVWLVGAAVETGTVDPGSLYRKLKDLDPDKLAQVIALLSAALYFMARLASGYFYPDLNLAITASRRSDSSEHDLCILTILLKKGGRGSVQVNDLAVRWAEIEWDKGLSRLARDHEHFFSFDEVIRSSFEHHEFWKRKITHSKISRANPFYHLSAGEEANFQRLLQLTPSKSYAIEVILLGSTPSVGTSAQWRASAVVAPCIPPASAAPAPSEDTRGELSTNR